MKYLLKNKGFTLIELLILVAILSIFLSAIFPLVIKNISLNNQSKLKLKATQAAQTKIEELRGANFDELKSGPFNVSSIPGATGIVQVLTDIDGDGTDETDIVKVNANVNYNIKSKVKSVELSTYISRTGIAK